MSSAPAENLLLKDFDYQIQETDLGEWRRYLYPTGILFEEFTSHLRILGVPFLHYTRGPSPETGKAVTAVGIIAIGRFAMGIVALGQVSMGMIAVGQAGFGVLLGIGQLSTGMVALGQLSLAILFGFGQLATGYIAIGQLAFGNYVMAQIGKGAHVWDMNQAAQEAQDLFRSILPW